MLEQTITKEDEAIVLDFLPNGYPFDTRPSYKKLPIVQAIGKKHLVLLELAPKKEIFLQPGDTIYIGEGKRDQIHHIIGKINFEKLSNTARTELNFVISDLIKLNEQKFVNFFNKAQPLTTRMHQLELLPGIGKRHMWEILEKRDEKPFESLKDVKERVKLIADPEKILIKRVLSELEGKEKYNLFVDN